MKNILFFLLLIALVACDGVKDMQEPLPTVNEAVPQVAINAIRKEYPEATSLRFSVIEKNKMWESEFRVKVDDMSAIVDNLGKISEAYKKGNIGSSLPSTATSYIEKNYPNSTILSISEQVDIDKKVIGYRVLLKTADNKELALNFDVNGTFLLLVGERKDPTGNAPRFYFVEETNLPTAIKTYLTEKHAGYKFIKGGVMNEGNNKTYSVVISVDLSIYEYIFDENANVLRSGSMGISSNLKNDVKSLEEKDIPSSVKSYLDKEFKGWEFQKGNVFSQAGQTSGYLILIKYNKKTYSLQFDSAGKLLTKQEIGESHSSQANLTLIQEKDLPRTVIDYLKNKHKEYRYIQISSISNGTEKTYWVTVAVGNMAYDYTFDKTGNVLKTNSFTLKSPMGEDKKLESKDIPEGIKNYLNQNYNGWTFVAAKTELSNGLPTEYTIVIKYNGETYFVSFDSKQQFISTRKG